MYTPVTEGMIACHNCTSPSPQSLFFPRRETCTLRTGEEKEGPGTHCMRMHYKKSHESHYKIITWCKFTSHINTELNISLLLVYRGQSGCYSVWVDSKPKKDPRTLQFRALW